MGHSRMFIESSLSHSCIVLAVCVGWLSCWKVNFQPSLRFWALWTRFSLRISLYLAVFSFPSSLITFPVPAAENTNQCCCAAATMLHRWDGIMQVISGAWFPSEMNKELRFIRPENLFFHSQLFWCIFVNSNQGFMYLYWGEAWVWSLCHQAQIGGVSQWCLSFCKFLPAPYKIMELNQSDHQCLDHLSNQDPSPSIAQFGQEARSRKSPDCFKLHPLRIVEAKCSCEPSTQLNTAEFFCSLPQICLNTIPSLSSAGHSFDLMA